MDKDLVKIHELDTVPKPKSHPTEVVDQWLARLELYEDYFLSTTDDGKPEQTLNYGSLAYLYLAAGHHLPEVDRLLVYALHTAVKDKELVEVSLAITKSELASQHGKVRLGTALVKFCAEMDSHLIPLVTNQIIALSLCSAELTTNIIHCASILETTYPGGILNWINQVKGLPEQAMDHWLNICCEKDGAGTEAANAFLQEGREIVAIAGEKIGHWWFLGFDRKADISSIKRSGARAKQILQFILNSPFEIDDEHALFSYMLDLIDYPAEDLISALTKIHHYCLSQECELTADIYGAYFEELLDSEADDEDVFTIDPIGYLYSAMDGDKLYSRVGPCYPSTFYKELRNVGIRGAPALSLLKAQYSLTAHIEVESLLQEPNEVESELAAIVTSYYATNSSVETLETNEWCDVQESLVQSLLDKLEVIAQKPNFKVSSLKKDLEKLLTKIQSKSAKILRKKLPLDSSKLVAEILRVEAISDNVGSSDDGTTINEGSLAAWKEDRSTLPGLMPVGGKIHFPHSINAEEFEAVKAELGLTSTYFRLIHAGCSLILPAGQSSDVTRLIRALVAKNLFKDNRPDLQVSIAGRWPEEVAAIVGASIILGSDQGIIYKNSAFATTHDRLTGARIMLYDDGTRWTGGAFDLAEAHGRTDMLGRHAGVDILHYQVLGTLASHAVYNGRWQHLFEEYSGKFRTTLEKYGLDETIHEASWLFEGKTDDKDDVRRHSRMVNKFSHAWIEAQEAPNGGVAAEVLDHIHDIIRKIHAERELTRALFPEEWAKLSEVTFVHESK